MTVMMSRISGTSFSPYVKGNRFFLCRSVYCFGHSIHFTIYHSLVMMMNDSGQPAPRHSRVATRLSADIRRLPVRIRMEQLCRWNNVRASLHLGIASACRHRTPLRKIIYFFLRMMAGVNNLQTAAIFINHDRIGIGFFDIIL